ncbi:DUF29 domain-containing protein [Crocosphaera sp. UHCC 0190]|uniref:DUF29 domain-containing protein n=1 Tax=Crocosphaera sp. UHCC 0190 TaxID=3110246 RepID=UPI002B2212B6|nr:DUF29 domain-containing protein [Crocosphaera sp. UHCC 0190]MEA5511512.1 DUF29 domain-containing protein [Crocosphaera sp. UHCC 0190]
MSKTLYDQDFQKWIETTIYQLQKGEFSSLDIDHLVEELTDLGKSEKRALESNLMILLAHLLKLKVQHDAPSSMKDSWYGSIIEHRQRVQKNLRDTPSLKAYFKTAIENAYSDARKIAIKEGKLAKFGVSIPQENEYPKSCPFSQEQILDEDFYGN